jgi:hypothetical protein
VKQINFLPDYFSKKLSYKATNKIGSDEDSKVVAFDPCCTYPFVTDHKVEQLHQLQ